MAPREATIAITGDVMLGRLVDDVLRRAPPEFPWGGMLPHLREADLLLVNLECALTARHERVSDVGKSFFFRSDPRHVRALSAAGVDLAVLANNHAMDFGVEGMRETIRVLDEAGIAHVGAGGDDREARAVARLHVGELRVAVIAFADHPAEWAAGPERPGISFVPIEASSCALVREQIAGARRDADIVVVSLHWGPNMRARPSVEFRRFAHSVAEGGADVLWGHSAHVVQGIEVHDGRLICYDTGDFVDDYAIDRELRNDLTALFLLRVVDGRVRRVELIPARIDQMRVQPAQGADRVRFSTVFVESCAELGTKVATARDSLLIDLD